MYHIIVGATIDGDSQFVGVHLNKVSCERFVSIDSIFELSLSRNFFAGSIGPVNKVVTEFFRCSESNFCALELSLLQLLSAAS